MIKARLFVWGIERELLRTELEYHRTLNDKTGRPGPIPMGGLVTFSFISGYNDDVLLRWITHSLEDELCTLTACKIVFYEGDLDGIVLFEYQLNDAALVYWKETFHSVGEESMTVTMAISAAIQEIKGSTWVKPWQESGVPPGKNVTPEKGGAEAALGDGRKRVDDGGELWEGGTILGSDAATLANAGRMVPEKGMHPLLVHGHFDNFIINGTITSPKSVARTMLQSGFKSGTPIRCISCHTGALGNGAAYQLSRYLRSPVLAPTDKVRILQGGQYEIFGNGIWKQF